MKAWASTPARQLAEAEQVVRQQIRDRWLDAGVTMIDPASTWIDAGVTIGKDTVLYPNVMLEGTTVIGEDTIVRSGTQDYRLHDRQPS